MEKKIHLVKTEENLMLRIQEANIDTRIEVLRWMNFEASNELENCVSFVAEAELLHIESASVLLEPASELLDTEERYKFADPFDSGKKLEVSDQVFRLFWLLQR